MGMVNNICFRCYFPGGHYTEHRQELPLEGIPVWLEAYKYTHPNVVSISVKVWFHEGGVNGEA